VFTFEVSGSFLKAKILTVAGSEFALFRQFGVRERNFESADE
jgi:hypothetical protein